MGQGVGIVPIIGGKKRKVEEYKRKAIPTKLEKLDNYSMPTPAMFEL